VSELFPGSNICLVNNKWGHCTKIQKPRKCTENHIPIVELSQDGTIVRVSKVVPVLSYDGLAEFPANSRNELYNTVKSWSWALLVPQSPVVLTIFKMFINYIKHVSKAHRCGHVCLRLVRYQKSNIFLVFFQVRLGNFWKFLVSNFLVLVGLSICIIIPTSFPNAFFRVSRMQNFKMFGWQNFCLPLIYLDIEFHQNRLNPNGSQFFIPKSKILKMFLNDF